MDNSIKDFIEANIDVIEEEDFLELYNRADRIFYQDSQINDLTRTLHSVDIYPEFSLKILPSYYIEVDDFENYLSTRPALAQNLASRNENHKAVKAAKTYLIKSDMESTYNVKNPPAFIYNKKTQAGYIYARNYVKELIIDDSVSTLGNGVFARSPKLKSVKFGKNLKAIGPSVFEGCTQLEEAIIPDSVKVVAEGAFTRCVSLKKIKFSANQEKIDILTCAGCTHLSQVIIPEGITLIDSKAFRDCIFLTSITLPSSLEIIGEAAFRGSGLISFSSTNVNTIFGNAFENNISLVDLDLNDDLKVIKNRVFAGCTNLRVVTLPKNLLMIGNAVFADCDRSLVVNYYKPENDLNWSLNWNKGIKTNLL